jgi:uncharacterized protein
MHKLVLITAVAAFIGGTFFGMAVLRLATGQGEIHGQPWVARTQEASTKIAAVRSDGPGVICNLKVKISPGEGRILVDTHLLIGFDFQYAERIAVKVASKVTGIELDDDGIGFKGADVLFVVSVPTEESVEIQAIDGPSAGAATTLATIAAIENRALREDVIITGTIQEDGRVGPVGGVFEKAKAADNAGAKLFLVPSGQSVVTMYKEVVRELGPFRWVTYEPIRVDLNQYAQEAGWNIEIREVSTIEEAIDLMLEETG